ncbi:MAG TPA: glycosyltransferase family 1 protein [Planctomycetota bacterium]|jgi:glycosyltransferase involved in cell wall biosynthesis|nr:glycosyltransferase family 4 protein [Planctomycetota bacterium]OQC19332.1 MAG: N-acetylgalactosamine-N,N'-diacetylbacillosaminyl-diphospho-undecaprenol 4-alpha-N-acetylgalactosaminyltransferase [Planctomycetes bacterium ADurb.Bin069]HNS00408.1 glycosyltransferase family 1 protein [Planctomycetota bacterium]HNU26987.1 glycosyltransferase family 1 protein [Planctomycetota bacterium]HOE31330.1 glycosyltransferase family 1 protein [Planctomycetota bacterium]
MIVTIDGTDWLYGERAIRRHVANLVALVGTFGEDIDYRIFLNRFRPSPYGRPPSSRPRVAVKTVWCPPRIFYTLNARWDLASIHRFSGPTDVFHAAGACLPRCRAREYVYTVPGFAAYARPELLPPAYAARMAGAIRRALPWITHFLAVSETTRREVVEILQVPPECTSAIPLGIDGEFGPRDPEACFRALASRLPLRRPYVLYIGGIDKLKNTAGLVRAFASVARAAFARHQLVLVGPTYWLDRDIKDAIAAADLGGRILLAGPHGGEDLVRFYGAADLFVFPTFYEGWTSPPLEAMACGVPVVASNASSVPETVGDAAVLVDPNDPAAIARGMCRVLEDASLRQALTAKGFARAALFTWEKTVKSTVELYARLGAR